MGGTKVEAKRVGGPVSGRLREQRPSECEAWSVGGPESWKPKE